MSFFAYHTFEVMKVSNHKKPNGTSKKQPAHIKAMEQSENHAHNIKKEALGPNTNPKK